jgi:hypothetical protein
MFGFDHRRVVQIAVRSDADDSTPTMGSGYRVSESYVLTAHHVVDEAQHELITVWSHTGGWSCGVASTMDLGDDVALIEIRLPVIVELQRQNEPPQPVDPPSYGHLDRSPAELAAVALGHPVSALKKTQADARKIAPRPYRDFAQTHGRIRSLHGAVQGIFTFEIATLGDADISGRPSPSGYTGEPAAPQSNWYGMSGAALWVNDVLVGVITEDRSRSGSERLVATRIDHVLRRLEREASETERAARTALGLYPGEELADANFDATAVLDAAEWDALRNILEDVAAVPSVKRIFLEAVDFGLPASAAAGSAVINAGLLRQSTDATRLFSFLVHYAAKLDDDYDRARLDRWIDQKANRWRVDLQKIREDRRRARPPILLVQLEPDEQRSETWRVTAWLYTGLSARQVLAPDDDPWTLEDLSSWLGAQIASMVNEFDSEGRPQTTLSVEFIVSTDTLEADFESIPVMIGETPHALGELCPVVMRSLDRLREDTWLENLFDKWFEFDKSSHDDCPDDIIGWIEQPSQIVGDAKHLIAALTYGGHLADRTATLNAVLAAGTPVVVWHRRIARGQGRRAALNEILSGGILSELPRRVRGHRLRSARAPRRPGRNNSGSDLVLLWDDANRIPEIPDYGNPQLEGA